MKAPKMNILYKISFILMLVCVVLLAVAMVFLLLIENTTAGVVISVAGVFLCLIAIILTMFSKPKAAKKKEQINSDAESKNYLDSDSD